MEITNFTKTPLNAYDMLVGNYFEFDLDINVQHFHVTGFADANGRVKFNTDIPHCDKVAKEIKALM